MRVIALMLMAAILTGCAAKRKSATTATASTSGDSRTVAVTMLNNNTYLLATASADERYAFSKDFPVKVGGGFGEGPLNERRFLNALLGPEGQQVHYTRMGSCCGFTTPNSPMGTGLLDRYKVYWEGATDTSYLYLNMYDKGDLFIPKGFTAKQ